MSHTLHLTPSLSRPRGWLMRLIRGPHPHTQPIAELSFAGHTLRLERTHSHSRSVDLSAPFDARLTRSSDTPDHLELTLHITQNDTWLPVSTTAPLDALTSEPPPLEDQPAACLELHRFARLVQGLRKAQPGTLPELRDADTLRSLPRIFSTRKALQCSACQSYDVATPHPRVFECLDCGYAYGDGIAERQRAARARAIEAIPEDDRRLLADLHLDQATPLLTEVSDDMRRYHTHGVEGTAYMRDALRDVDAAHSGARQACDLAGLDADTELEPFQRFVGLGADPIHLAMQGLDTLAEAFQNLAKATQNLSNSLIERRPAELRAEDARAHLELALDTLTLFEQRLDDLAGVGTRRGAARKTAGDMAYEYNIKTAVHVSANIDFDFDSGSLNNPGTSANDLRAENLIHKRARASFLARRSAIADALNGAADARSHLRITSQLDPALASALEPLIAHLEFAARHPQRVLGDQHEREQVRAVLSRLSNLVAQR